jgi:Fe-S-cluster-containing hydrogenase component 2
MSKCYGCWSCYNHCPKKAIYTRKFRGVGHYPKPNDLLKEKLKAC